MRHRTSVLVGVLVLALGLSGCGGSDSPATPLTPSPPPQQAVVPAPTPCLWVAVWLHPGGRELVRCRIRIDANGPDADCRGRRLL